MNPFDGERQRTTYLTIEEVADLIQSSTKHVLNAIRGKLKSTRALPAARIGRKWLVDEVDLLAWLELCKGRNIILKDEEPVQTRERNPLTQ